MIEIACGRSVCEGGPLSERGSAASILRAIR
jgi:hypothetical protein